eukprot:1145230-Pelagomonas_calceolata.AAC.1
MATSFSSCPPRNLSSNQRLTSNKWRKKFLSLPLEVPLECSHKRTGRSPPHPNTTFTKEKKRKVYAGHRPRASRKGPLTSKLARASPEVPQNYTSYS